MKSSSPPTTDRRAIVRRLTALREHAQSLTNPTELAAVVRATEKLEAQLERLN